MSNPFSNKELLFLVSTLLLTLLSFACGKDAVVYAKASNDGGAAALPYHRSTSMRKPLTHPQPESGKLKFDIDASRDCPFMKRLSDSRSSSQSESGHDNLGSILGGKNFDARGVEGDEEEPNLPLSPSPIHDEGPSSFYSVHPNFIKSKPGKFSPLSSPASSLFNPDSPTSPSSSELSLGNLPSFVEIGADENMIESSSARPGLKTKKPSNRTHKGSRNELAEGDPEVHYRRKLDVVHDFESSKSATEGSPSPFKHEHSRTKGIESQEPRRKVHNSGSVAEDGNGRATYASVSIDDAPDKVKGKIMRGEPVKFEGCPFHKILAKNAESDPDLAKMLKSLSLGQDVGENPLSDS